MTYFAQWYKGGQKVLNFNVLIFSASNTNVSLRSVAGQEEVGELIIFEYKELVNNSLVYK